MTVPCGAIRAVSRSRVAWVVSAPIPATLAANRSSGEADLSSAAMPGLPAIAGSSAVAAGAPGSAMSTTMAGAWRRPEGSGLAGSPVTGAGLAWTMGGGGVGVAGACAAAAA